MRDRSFCPVSSSISVMPCVSRACSAAFDITSWSSSPWITCSHSNPASEQRSCFIVPPVGWSPSLTQFRESLEELARGVDPERQVVDQEALVRRVSIRTGHREAGDDRRNALVLEGGHDRKGSA